MIRTTAIAIAIIVAMPAAAPAFADPYKDRPTRTVPIADLDLARPADQDEMVHRVEEAAKRICKEEPTRVARRACARETIDYTLNLVTPELRGAYTRAEDRRGAYALAQN
jgi:UrcA family protein